MSAIEARTGMALVALAGALHLASPAFAQDASANDAQKVTLKLAQKAAPGAQPWNAPGLLSYTINRKGADSYDVELNADLDVPMLYSKRPHTISRMSLGPSAAYARSNAADSQTDTLKLGVAGKYILDPNLGFGGGGSPPGKDKLLYSIEGNLDYSREGVFPDRSKPPCDTNTTAIFCRKQFSESLKGSIDFYPYLPGFESGDADFGYSVRPRLEFAHDEILDGAVDPATGLKVTGGHTSVLAGLGLTLTPGFVNAPFELNLTGTVRRRLAVSASRAGLSDQTEGRMQASLTYFVTPVSRKKGWRAGISLIWTEGQDSFAGDKPESTIVLAFRIGRF